MNDIVATAGLHGYSSPCPDHVIFSVSPDVYSIISQSEAWAGLCAEHMQVGRGCWKGVEEPSFALPLEVYEEMNRRWPFIMRDQDSVLILGTPESMNWRPATCSAPANLNEGFDYGVWLEVTEAEARASDGWSCFNGHWFICKDDPPDSIGTAEERILEAKAALLDELLDDRECTTTTGPGFLMWVSASQYSKYKKLGT